MTNWRKWNLKRMGGRKGSRAGIPALLLACLIPACDPLTDPGGTDSNTNDNDNEAPSGIRVTVVSPNTSFALPQLSPSISVIYTVVGTPASIRGIYAPVGGFEAGAPLTGEAVELTDDLGPGVNQQFRFNPSEVEIGNYRVGIRVRFANGTADDVFGLGVIQVQGPPDPRFVQPPESVTEVVTGGTVPVSFDSGDPENQVQWRLFYLRPTDRRDLSPDQLGIQLAVGSGNVGQFTFTTTGLDVGDYELGISATDSGFSVATTAQQEAAAQQNTTTQQDDRSRIVTIPNSTGTVRGPMIRVIEPPVAQPPTVTFASPSASNVTLFGSETLTIRVTVAIREPEGVGSVDFFYDTDSNFSNGVSLIEDATDLELFPGAAEVLEVPLPNTLAEGTYRIGVSVSDGINPVVFSYAPSSVMIVRTATLVVTEPNTSLPIAPSSPTQTPNTAPVAWTTNVPVGAGRTVDVFAQVLSSMGVPTGPEIAVLPPRPLSTTSALFSSQTSGQFAISVRIRFGDATPPLVRQAPQPIRVSSLPRVLWLGSIAEPDPPFEAAVFEGVNFEDNAGSSFAGAGDLNGDGLGDFVIVARYGKPYFVNPTGVGPGEAYLLFGAGGQRKLLGLNNLNSLGTSILGGVTFTGIRTPQNSSNTDGISAVSRIPDVDGDGADELVFGIPHTDSRGHNIDPRQDGVVNPLSLSTLEREGQFMRGGIVIVSSQNSVLQAAMTNPPPINLDLVGQDFLSTCVGPEPDGVPEDIDTEFGAENFTLDVLNPASTPVPCVGGCENPQSGGASDANSTIDYGFVRALARDYFFTYVYAFDFFSGLMTCDSVEAFVPVECVPLQYCRPFPSGCEPFSPGLHTEGAQFELVGVLPVWNRRSGYYNDFINVGTDNDPNIIQNQPLEPLGARVVGVALNDRFGTSLSLSNALRSGSGDIIVSAPERTARGILLGPAPAGCTDPPSCGGEIDGLQSSATVGKSNQNSGVAYLFPLRSLWTDDAVGRVPPMPHQYIVGEASHCGGPLPRIDNIDAIRIAGFADDRITNIIGIDDFNRDGRNDFAIGAPEANTGQGRIYIAFRRDPAVEGDYVLEKLALDPNSPDRLAGVLINTSTADGLGSSLATGVDLNNDGFPDLVIGSPNANNGIGEVIVVFGASNLTSPVNGVSVRTLLTSRNASGQPRAARIQGNPLDVAGLFGFNVANAGDVDGDGKNDLLIAAPNGSPRFDPNPMDDMDQMTDAGIDLDFDGVKDDVSGPLGLPNGEPDSADDLTRAGIVYFISSRNNLGTIPRQEVTVNIRELGGNLLRGFMIVGRRAGDRIGGGDAGDAAQGGLAGKIGRGRSRGLASAGDVDGDRRADILIGSVLADTRRDPNTGQGIQNGGEAYLIYGSAAP